MVTLPIYHSNAGVLGVGSALISGATLVLRKKFSVSTFWKDAVKYRCTGLLFLWLSDLFYYNNLHISEDPTIRL